MRLSHILLFAWLTAAHTTAADSTARPLASRVPVIFNQDSSEFFVGTFGPIEPDTVDRYVDSLAGTGVTDLFVCVNAQRTNFRSSVWESDWDGYNPDQGDKQPFFAGIEQDRAFERDWYKKSYHWSRTSVDYPERMISRSRKNGMKGWISVRMNDAHYPKQPAHPYHSAFWRDHPEWHLTNGSLDYARPEVRKHYLNLVREITERYDLDGLELDFMRHGHYFRPGEENAGRRLMTDFIREAHAAVAQAAVRLRHPVKLGVRVPSRPWAMQQRGLDAVAWAKESLVDLIVASPWWASTDGDVPIETWKGLLAGTGTHLACAVEDGISSGSSRRRTMLPDEFRGIALSAIERGADAIYLFNFFTGPFQEWPKQTYRELLLEIGSAALLERRTRSHPATLVDPWAEGEPGYAKPFSSSQAETVSLRIPIGPAPSASDRAYVVLVTANQQPPPAVRVNGVVATLSRQDGEKLTYAVPKGICTRGYSLLRIESRPDSLQWAEIRVEPASP